MTCKCGCECYKEAANTSHDVFTACVDEFMDAGLMFTARDVYNITYLAGIHNEKYEDIYSDILNVIETALTSSNSYTISIINNIADASEYRSYLYRPADADPFEYPLANTAAFINILENVAAEISNIKNGVEEELPEKTESDEEEELPETDELPEEEELLEENEEEELPEEDEDDEEEDEDDYIETDNWSYLDTIESDESGRIIIPAKYIQKIKFDNSDSRTAYVESYYIDYEDSSEPVMEIALYEDILTPDKEVILTPNYSLRLATKRVFKNETTFKVYLDVVKNTLIVCSENYDIDKE
jgi:hypothetical protein